MNPDPRTPTIELCQPVTDYAPCESGHCAACMPAVEVLPRPHQIRSPFQLAQRISGAFRLRRLIPAAKTRCSNRKGQAFSQGWFQERKRACSSPLYQFHSDEDKGFQKVDCAFGARGPRPWWWATSGFLKTISTKCRPVFLVRRLDLPIVPPGRMTIWGAKPGTPPRNISRFGTTWAQEASTCGFSRSSLRNPDS